MRLYDGQSSVDWLFYGTMTKDQMLADERFSAMVQETSVLFDDGAGGVYDWRFLSALASEWGVEMSDDSQAVFDSVLAAMSTTTPDPVDKAVEAAEEAKAEAAEAKAAADAASEAANPQVVAFAAMVMPTFTPTVSDSRIAEVNTLLPDFVSEGYEYKKGQCFNYEGRTWRVSSDHTSQSQWKPGDVGTESLYYEIVIAPDGIIVWAQPRGDFDAPDNGDLRHFPDADGPVYRSLVDGNAYSPEAYPQNWEKA